MQPVSEAQTFTRSSGPVVSNRVAETATVVPDNPPGSVRLDAADTLRRLATRLDRGHQPHLGYGRPA
jgi:hypothetical protein